MNYRWGMEVPGFLIALWIAPTSYSNIHKQQCQIMSNTTVQYSVTHSLS